MTRWMSSLQEVAHLFAPASGGAASTLCGLERVTEVDVNAWSEASAGVSRCLSCQETGAAAELEELIETQVDRRNQAARSAETWTLSGDVDMAHRAKARAKMHHQRAEHLLAELRALTAEARR